MSSGPDELPPSASEPSSDGRLDSWKEIAAYLRRSVRSARRWEKEEGLPVRRHAHGKGDSVYAYKTDLDGWWNNRGANLGDENGAEEAALPPEPKATNREPTALESGSAETVPPSSPRRSRRVVWIGAGFALAALLVGVFAWLPRNGSATPARVLRPLPFKARDWVLVADFENRTGEKLLDGTLDYALGWELSNSRFVNVVPRERVGDALRLMRRPPDSPISAAVGREVCLRDGEIRALLTGRVEKLASKYVLSVEIVEPKQGTTLAGFSEEVSARDGSLAAVRRISDRVRRSLGETLPAESSDRPLVKVTTANLRALQLYSQADSLMAGGGSQSAAEELLRQAVAEDPDFASAYIHLAHAINNQSRPPEDYRPYLETAFRLSETTTERERFFIRGSYYQLLGQREKAIAAYEALLTLYPDHAWALGNLAEVYPPDDLERVVRLELRLAELLPQRFDTNWNAGFNFVVWERDPARAEHYLSRARALVTPDVMAEFPWMVGWLQLLPFTDDWLQSDLEPAAKELDRFAGELESVGGRAREILAVKAALSYLTLGRIDAAERIAGKIFEPVTRNDMLAQICFIEGDALALRKHLRYEGKRGLVPSQGWAETWAILQARAGSVQQVRLFLKEPEEKRGERSRAPTKHNVSGELALAQGNLDAAIQELEEGANLQREWHPHQPGFYLASESLAAALKRKGDLPRAIQVLERASAKRFEAVIVNNAGAYWLRIRFDLARLYRSAGRVEEARAVEAELLKLLAVADANHPILLELRRLATS